MARLGDLCRFINGDRGKNYPSQAEISSDGDVPFINAGHLVDGKLDFSDMNYISEEKYNQLNSGKIQENDVLYCLRGSLGKKAIIKGISKGAIASSLVIIRPDARLINSDYLFYALESPTVQEQMMQANNGSSQPNLSAKSVSDYTFNLPTINKQCEIVLKLAKVNDLISLRKEQLTKLDQLVKSRFVELFGDCENEVLIGDVISISRGASPRPISAFITDGDDGVNWIKIGDVSENSLYITKTEEKITPEGAKKSRMVYQGDFILSNSMSFGRPYILGINGCVHDGWLIMSNFKDTFNELYLYHAIRSDDVQYQFSGKVNGATVKNLNSDLVKNTFIKVPSMEFQEQFAAFVEQTDKSKLAIQQSLDKLELLKKSLMQEYFG